MNLFLYVHTRSWLHRIDPRIKIFSVFCVVCTALIEQELLPLLFLCAVVLLTG
ncbi:hypothetical protein [Methanospirillum hungatei]|uniref:hypothetical protein n=1 Tax=Methanospirillum hungatei TaxID=2203 RepID=UPI0026F22D5F|nr:hypothetical protein [Methanospirillum hungatei]MCA1915844.1 hypothetical protein [Methanospirillum hungatei]